MRKLLFPFSCIYAAITWLRNKAYDWGVFHSQSFSVPVIVVGNLNVGGSGKSPMVEYLLRALSGKYQLATLSRGYGRKSKGFHWVEKVDTAAQSGDEPLQFKRKFPEIAVAVDANRVDGIQRIIQEQSATQIIVLDDAYQHRAVKPGFSILISDFQLPFYKDVVLPAGNLRELRSGTSRADAIIISKVPYELSNSEQETILRSIQPMPHQQVYFSGIRYGEIYSLDRNVVLNTPKDVHCFLFSGIANPRYFEEHARQQFAGVHVTQFSDHHRYTAADIKNISGRFQLWNPGPKIILTTEKDAMRLSDPALKRLLEGLPIYFIPIQHFFYGDGEERFDKQLTTFIQQKIK